MSIPNNNSTKTAGARIVNSRIALKIDTWQAWQEPTAKALVLHAGEVAFVQMGTVPPIGQNNGTSEVLFKVGDGTTTFENLPWGSAKAADVYGWAKQNESEFKAWLSGETKVGGTGEDKDDPVIGDPFVLKSVFDAAVTSINASIANLTKATTDTTEATSLASRLAVVEGLAGIGGEGSTGSLATVDYVDNTKKALIGNDTTVDTIKYAIKQASEAGTAASTANTVATRAEGKADTLIGSDTDKSVREIANDELAKQLVPENAKESLDSLQEIAAWIQNHPDDAAELNRLLSGLGTTGEGGSAKAKTVKEYVDEAVDAEETARSNAITSAIEALDVSEITVGAGKTLASIKQEDGKIVVTPVDIAITKSQVTDFAHNHNNDYADKTATEDHIANGNIHVTADQKTSWDAAAPKAESAIQGVKVNGTELTPDATKKVDVKIETGNTNGNIKVNGTDVAVKGLGSAAYTDVTAYASSTSFNEHVSKAVTTETYLLIDCGSSTVNVD